MKFISSKLCMLKDKTSTFEIVEYHTVEIVQSEYMWFGPHPSIVWKHQSRCFACHLYQIWVSTYIVNGHTQLHTLMWLEQRNDKVNRHIRSQPHPLNREHGNLSPSICPADCTHRPWHQKYVHVAIPTKKRWTEHLSFSVPIFFVYSMLVCTVTCYVPLMRAAAW